MVPAGANDKLSVVESLKTLVPEETPVLDEKLEDRAAVVAEAEEAEETEAEEAEEVEKAEEVEEEDGGL